MKRVFLVLFMIGLAPTVFAQDIKREVTRVTFDVYRIQNQFHMNMFVITGNGVVVIDLISAEAATWLKSEIARLTDEPISHLIYSHSHGDHASGGTEYDNVPNVIAQHNAPPAIDGVKPSIRFGDQLSFTQGRKTLALTYLGPGHANDLIARYCQLKPNCTNYDQLIGP